MGRAIFNLHFTEKEPGAERSEVACGNWREQVHCAPDLLLPTALSARDGRGKAVPIVKGWC